MITKPKARKFRIKRSTSAEPGEPPQTEAAAPVPPRPRAVSATETAASTGEVPPPSEEVSSELDIDAIRREGLTGRQLRMARRVAQKHGLPATSDFDAVRLLREEGIDPFQRSNMLELVVPQAGGGQHEGAPGDMFAALESQKGGAGSRVQLPQTVPTDRETLPSIDTNPGNPMERRMREISDIQRDITRRRQKKMGLLLVRLAFFVMIPTFLAGYYFYNIATPLYATDSQFMIIQNEGSGSPGGLGGLLPAQYAASQDSIATQSYLQSKDAMLRLDNDAGFKAHFTQDFIDPIQRLEENPTNEEAYSLYKKNVKIGYDPTEGVIRMEVIAADPLVATEFSERLLSYAEERANALSEDKREDAMRDARATYDDAVAKRREAQEALIKLQVENGADPEAVIAAIRTQITNYETLLIEKELELAALLDNARPNRAKVEGAQGDIRRLGVQLTKLNDRMNSATEGTNSLAQQAVTLQLAQADLASADATLQLALSGMEAARTEVNRQVRYLTVAVRPVPSEEPSYPRKFENTILAFLIFAGIYMMLSLTASILREQVTA